MLGQSEFLSHSISVLISIFMIFILVTTMNTIKNDYNDFSAKSQINQICNTVKSSIEKIYWPDGQANNTLLGSINLNLPERIATNNYKIMFSNSIINVTTYDGKIKANCTAGFDIIYNGTSSGGRTQIRWYNINNTNVITIGEI